ncbi:hypothetical protein CC80DRAFT_506738 [Byssothecium circinans]|uniref:Velvet domain-containing protein n=1 Tax=Byssothecium circinans TaxID=147558 RepID=A0A6A5TMH1_9PLEO|nr:hypothetical protein CC80DRAFT_506738 [Byssothecium circinans]
MYATQRSGPKINFRLEVGQQPLRARMCGFGDKDRRPITPPPCIRLVPFDPETNREIDAQEIDSTFFVLMVDLWDHEGTREVNLVRHSSGAPTVSISSSTTTSFPPPAERTMHLPPGPLGYSDHGVPIYHSQMYHPHPGAGYYPAHGVPAQLPGPGYPGNYPSVPGTRYPPVSHHVQMPMAVPAPPPTNSGTGMFTRNLIGSLAVNASKLKDTENKLGFWFVLQDLSVRTEGTFRLKMNFVDVSSGNNNNTLNTARAPILASTFSDPFQVFSAKKFPGVIESTPLSKAFASQGIKIPIRGPKNNNPEYDNDDQ